MNPQEINRKIAEWLGWCWNPYQRLWLTDSSLIELPDFFHTSAAFNLLDVLVERGYYPDMFYSLARTWNVRLWLDGEETVWIQGAKTKSAAICLAIIALLEKEKQNATMS